MRSLAFTCVLCFNLVSFFCFFIAPVDSVLYEGDACTGPGGIEGVCTNVTSCSAIRQMIKNRVRLVHCEWTSSGPIVCCPPKTPRKSTTPTTTATTTPTTTTTTTTTLPPDTASRITADNPTNGNAAKMCLEYARYVYVKMEDSSLSILEEASTRDVSTCASESEVLIVGGEKAGVREFPHMVALGYGQRDSISWQCGGNLISNKFVLTVAHCLSNRERQDVRWARLGDLDLNTELDDANAVTIEVERALVHEGYKPPSHYNDIALLELKDEVTFSPDIRPACLRTEAGDPLGHVVIATGWGKNDSANEEGIGVLMKVDLKILSPETCNRTLRAKVGKRQLLQGVTDGSMMCAGDLEAAVDTCQGDSGGPLQFLLDSPYCMYSIIGLTSFGSTGCGIGLSASVYTRVSNYIGWIESRVWP